MLLLILAVLQPVVAAVTNAATQEPRRSTRTRKPVRREDVQGDLAAAEQPAEQRRSKRTRKVQGDSATEDEKGMILIFGIE